MRSLIQSLKSKKLTKVLLASTILLISLNLIWDVLSGKIPHYPRAATVKDCGGQWLNLSKDWRMVVFTTCFSTIDDFSQVQSWYEAKGWFRFNERLVFPGLRIGALYFESGKQYDIQVREKDSVLIIQQRIYRIGPVIVTSP